METAKIRIDVNVCCRLRVRGAAGHDVLDRPVRAPLPLPGGAVDRLRRSAVLCAQASREGIFALPAQVRGTWLSYAISLTSTTSRYITYSLFR